MNAYSDIRQCSRPIPSRPRMPRQNRAKIFAPYDALKGFEETVHAKDAVYVRRIELSEYAAECLDRKLRRLHRGNHVTVTWFQAKQGSDDLGEYQTSEGVFTGVDVVHHILRIGKLSVRIADVLAIEE